MGWKLDSPSWSSFLVLQIVIALSTRVVADYAPYYESAAYDNGDFGTWPTETYRSAPLLGPSLNYIQRSPLCGSKDEYGGDELYTFLAPRGSAVRTPGPMIIDHQGHLVWTKDYGQTHGIGVYEFHGNRYLTFGVENDGIRGFGDGVYYMVSLPRVFRVNKQPRPDVELIMVCLAGLVLPRSIHHQRREWVSRRLA